MSTLISATVKHIYNLKFSRNLLQQQNVETTSPEVKHIVKNWEERLSLLIIGKLLPTLKPS